MKTTKNAKAVFNIILAVLMAAVFMPSPTYTSYAAVAKKTIRVTKMNYKGTYVKAKPGSSYKLKYKLRPAKLSSKAKEVTWKSSNSKIVSVTSVKNGYAKVKALKAGTAKVVVTSKNNKKASATWTFKVSKAVSSTVKTTALTGVSIKMYNAGSQDINSTVYVGDELCAVVSPSGASVSYQWYSGDTAIAGAVDSSYKVSNNEIGKTISVKITGVGQYSGTESSASTGVVAVKPTTSGDANVSTPIIINPDPIVIDHNKDTSTSGTASGSGGSKQTSDETPDPVKQVSIIGVEISTNGAVKVGSVLTAVVSPANATGVSYQWYADNVAISGATSSTFAVTTDMTGKSITVQAKGDNNTVTSAPTEKVPEITLIGISK
jgi:hypothetical protein